MKRKEDYIKSYKNDVLWGRLLMEYLKKAGDKGLTVEEIQALFPSKNRGTIIHMLYNRQVPRRAFKDKRTGKCRKAYLYPYRQGRNWKKWVKQLLKETKHGLSLTDILLETGVPKKDLSAYLASLQWLKHIETVKINSKYVFPITRYYLGEVILRSDEELFINRVNRRKARKLSWDLKTAKIKEVITRFIKTKGRFIVTEVMEQVQKELLSEAPSELTILKVIKGEGYQERYVYNLDNFTSRRHSYRVFYIGESIPLERGEILAEELPIALRIFILQSIKQSSRLHKLTIMRSVGKKLGYNIGVSTGKNNEWDERHVPIHFQKEFHDLIQERYIKMKRTSCTNVYYTLTEKGKCYLQTQSSRNF